MWKAPDMCREFPYVPELLLGVLMSTYSEARLRAILRTEGVQAWDIWGEFTQELCTSPEQSVCDNFVDRFSRIVSGFEQEDFKPSSEGERHRELQNEGKEFGEVKGDGDCLIHSILQGLVYVGVLPARWASDADFSGCVAKSCRAALNSLPQGDPLRPVARHLRNNSVLVNAAP